MSPASACGPAGAELPAGTITSVFTDIEGSTRRWESVPEAMARSLGCMTRRCVPRSVTTGGVVYSAMGDGMVVVFASAAGAVLEAQRALLAAPPKCEQFSAAPSRRSA